MDRITEVSGFDELRPDWQALWSRSADRGPFLTWEWARLWWEHFGGLDRLEILVARDGDRVEGIAPLLRSRIGAGPAAAEMLVGVGQETADYGGFLLGERPHDTASLFLDFLSAELRHGLRSVNLTRLRPGGDLLPAVREHVRGSGADRLVCEESAAYPFLDLGALDDPAEHLRRLDVKNDVWRRGRRFAEQHELTFDYDAEPDRAHLDELFALSELRWNSKAAAMVGLFAGESGRAFLTEVVPALRERGVARLSLVRADGRAVAARLGFESGDAYLGYKECFDPDCSQLGPGQYMTSQVLHAVEERGLHEFDFLRGEGAHKSKWANGEREVGYWTLHRSGARGALARKLMWNQLRLRRRRWST